ncbi:uncharacterized protein METZ01_LOCUS108537 [marine metagenome]|uniref:Uncharacterized protein n=1 Tax=marine metagenome TaxID=408172 RepID=A0A381WUR7_9ZZZZ
MFISAIKLSILLDKSGLSFFNLVKKLIEPVTNWAGLTEILLLNFLLFDSSRCFGFTQDGLKQFCVITSWLATCPRNIINAYLLAGIVFPRTENIP